MKKMFDAIVRLKEAGLTEDQTKALTGLLDAWEDTHNFSTAKEQTRAELHEAVKGASNKRILRKQLELLAEYSRMPDGNSQIPACSREMVQIYRELVKAESRAVLFYSGLFGVSLSVFYSLLVAFIKFSKRQ